MHAAIAGGLIGLLVGGPRGLLIGAVLGYLLSVVLRGWLVGSLRIAGSTLLEATFSVMGALCKADRVVTRQEIDAVEHIFRQLRLTPEQRADAKEAFRRGKQPDFDLDAAVDRFAALARGRRPLIELFLQLQCMAVAADGALHDAEHAMLVRIARRLGLHEQDVARLEALLRATGAAGGAAGQPPANRLGDAYKALGLSSDASEAEIKRRYRKLMSDNHPDKLAARGLPESMRAVAEERSREINAAYDIIKQARGIT